MTPPPLVSPEVYDQFEAILHTFLASDDFKQALLAHCCHTNKWHYGNQTIKVRLHLDGTWVCPIEYSWVKSKKECIVTLSQVSNHFTALEEIGDTRTSFEEILLANPLEARVIVERLYARQEAYCKAQALKSFGYIREGGRLD